MSIKRKCRVCGHEKPLEAFPAHTYQTKRGRMVGHARQCGACRSSHKKAVRNKHIDTFRACERAAWAENRDLNNLRRRVSYWRGRLMAGREKLTTACGPAHGCPAEKTGTLVSHHRGTVAAEIGQGS